LREDLASANEKLDGVALVGKDISKVVKQEFNKINTHIDTLKDELAESGFNSEALEELHAAITDATSEFASSATKAKDDSVLLRAIVGEATSAVRLVAAQLETLQAEVEKNSIVFLIFVFLIDGCESFKFFSAWLRGSKTYCLGSIIRHFEEFRIFKSMKLICLTFLFLLFF